MLARVKFTLNTPRFYLRPRLRRAPRRFIIIFCGRTGSSLITSALNRHPAVVCYPEVFVPKSAMHHRRILRGIQLGLPLEPFYCDVRSDYFIDGNPQAKQDLKAVGFKVKLRDVADPQALRQYINASESTVIHLVRDNIVKTVISKMNMSQLKRDGQGSNITTDDRRAARDKIRPDVLRKRIARRAELIRDEQAFVDSLGVPAHRFVYEDLLASPHAFLGTLQRTLGVDPIPLDGAFVKNTPDDLRAALPNFGELQNAFEGTPYHAQFDS